MKKDMEFPLLAKVLGWLMLHLLVLSLAFAAFVGWQFHLGLASLLSGAAGDRMRAFGEELSAELAKSPESAWPQILQQAGKRRGVQLGLHNFQRELPPADDRATARQAAGPPRGEAPLMRNIPIPPPNVDQCIRRFVQQPAPNPPNARPQDPPPRPPDDPWAVDPPLGPGFDGPPPRPLPAIPLPDHPARTIRAATSPEDASTIHPAFLVRGDQGDGYWAGVDLRIAVTRAPYPLRFLLLIRSDSFDGGGMFFDLKPWLWGGLAVLCLSLLCWSPFVVGITRYVGHLTRATGQIAAGQFDISPHHRRRDELGRLGRAIHAMAGRLDLLVRGQKRFLGDVAHELCSPLARIRTGLSVLESRIPHAEHPRLQQIEADAAELATLVEELLAFSRSSNRPATLEICDPAALAREVLAREGSDLESTLEIPAGLHLVADPRMFCRALGNLVRNARIHAGPQARVRITAGADTARERAFLTVSDNGPGVPEEEVARIFEPFYRPDRSRTRETGGSGLGLAIVKSCVEACGGSVSAENSPGGGFAVTMNFPLDRGLDG